MKVALLNTYPHGGAGTACSRLTRALPEVGVQATMLTRDEVGKKWPFYAERLSFLPFERDKSVRFSFSPANFGSDLRKTPALQAADVIHLHWVNQGFLSLKSISELSKLGKPLVWTLHDMWAFTGGCHYSGDCTRWQQACGQCPYLKNPSEHDLSNRVWRRKQTLFPKNIRFVTCSAWLAGLARESSLLRDCAIEDIPNPIDTRLFAPITDQERLSIRHRMGVPEDSFLLLFVAMKIGETRKGFHLLREALEHLRRQQPDLQVSLLVMGKSDPETLATLPYPVFPLGLVQGAADLAKAYAAADAFVIPSLEDNLPNTVMESLACGTPVAGFRTGGIPEMVTDADQGFLANPGDTVGLADSIHTLLRGAVPLSAYRLAARRKAMDGYANAVVGGRYKALYESLLNG